MYTSKNSRGRIGEVINAVFLHKPDLVNGLGVNVDCLASILLLQYSQMLQPDVFFKVTGKISGWSNLRSQAVHCDTGCAC